MTSSFRVNIKKILEDLKQRKELFINSMARLIQEGSDCSEQESVDRATEAYNNIHPEGT